MHALAQKYIYMNIYWKMFEHNIRKYCKYFIKKLNKGNLEKS